MSNIATPVRPLRVLLATAGSRGDVEPFLALAEALLLAEHDVLICAPDDPDSDGIPEIASLGVNFAELARAIEGLPPMRAFRDHIQPAMATALDRVVTHALEWHPDVIVTHPKLLTVPIVAESLGVPYLTVELTPILTPTADFPAAGSLAAISPTLVPRPADWPTTTHLTGDWPRQHQQRRQLNPRLAHFLAAETPFLYGGFGSMVGGNASARATAINSPAMTWLPPSVTPSAERLRCSRPPSVCAPKTARLPRSPSLPKLDHHPQLPRRSPETNGRRQSGTGAVRFGNWSTTARGVRRRPSP